MHLVYIRKFLPMAKEYVFKITMDGFDKRKLWRKVAVKDSTTLYRFAGVILGAFDFDRDHCFGFYSEMKRNMYDSDRVYEYFVDVVEEDGEDDDFGVTPGALGTKNTRVSEVWKTPKDEMLFYFDYGDNWRFFVRLESVSAILAKEKYPRVLESKGDAPEQYPNAKEEGEYDEDAEDEFSDMANTLSRLLLKDGLGGEIFSDTTLVKTGLGSIGEALRYSLLLEKHAAASLSKKEQHALEMELKKSASDFGGSIETISFDDRYVLFSLLVPVTVSLDEAAKRLSHVFEASGISVQPNYLCANTASLSRKQIEQFLNGKTPKNFKSA